MLRLTKHLALLLALCWLPAALHCQLEQAGLAPLLGCADRPDEADHPAEKSDCAADACQVVESGQLTLAHSRVALPVIVAAIVPSPGPVVLPPPAGAIPSPLSPPRAPLAHEHTWQFVRRAAPPARAPDALNA